MRIADTHEPSKCLRARILLADCWFAGQKRDAHCAHHKLHTLVASCGGTTRRPPHETSNRLCWRVHINLGEHCKANRILRHRRFVGVASLFCFSTHLFYVRRMYAIYIYIYNTCVKLAYAN